MRIALLGSGRQGIACAHDLLRENDLKHLLWIDHDRGALDRTRETISDARVERMTGDAADEQGLAGALRGSDSTVSALPYFLNPGITRAAIRAGVSMVDMGGNTEIVLQQRSLDEDARRAGVTIVPDLGLAPGLSNILAMAAIDGMAEVECLRIRCGGLPLDPQPPLGYAAFFSMHGLINEYSGEALCLREGRLTRMPTLTEPEWIAFPEPVGICRAVHTSGGSSTLPMTLAGRVRRLDYKTVRYPGHWPRIRFLKEIGLLGSGTIRVGDLSLPPRNILSALLDPVLDRGEVRDVVVLRVRARGKAAGEARASLVRQYDILEIGDSTPGLTAMAKLTAFPTAAVALRLARRELHAPGVTCAETVIDPEWIIRHLRDRGIEITRSETTKRNS